MNDQELKIKEYRTIEAKKKNLMGLNGKFGYILAALGQPIINHAESGGLYASNAADFLENWDTIVKDSTNFQPGTAEEIMKQIPTADTVEHNVPEGWEWYGDLDAEVFDEQKAGWHFDGLSRGMHLEITYKKSEKNLIVTYKGYQVFKEHSGDLRTYVPSEKWEPMIERLYKLSVEILKERGKLKLIEQNKMNKYKKAGWLTRLQEKWGFS